MIVDIKNYNNIIDGLPDEPGINAVECKNGLMTLSVSVNGKTRFLHSLYDPVAEAENQLKEISPEIEECYTVLVFGLGMGYHIQHILKLIPSGGVVHVFEPSLHIIKEFIKNYGLEMLENSSVRIYAAGAESFAFPKDILTLGNCDAFCFYEHAPSGLVFPEQREALISQINRASSGLLVQKESTRAFGLSWSVNFLENLKHLNNSAAVAGLFGRFSGKTAIIVSAGPSIAKNAELLAGARERAFVICCDAAYRLLAEKGISPDIIVSVSGNPRAHSKMAGLECNVPILYKSQSCYKILDEHSGEKFYSRYINGFLDDIMTQQGINAGFIDSGGSVSCSCLDLAVKAGASAVVLTGQDFALTGGESHAGEKEAYSSQDGGQEFIIETADIYGNQIKTLRNLNSYRIWFEQYIERCPQVRFIDATEGGALIKGTEIMTLEKALDEFLHEPFAVKETISAAYRRFPLKRAAEAARQRYSEAYEDFRRANELVESIIKELGERAVEREEILETADNLLLWTNSIKYSIFAEVLDIKNACVRQSDYIECFKRIKEALNSLSPVFERIREV